MSNELELDEFEVLRHGAWWGNIKRVDVKAFQGREPLWFWRFGHDAAGTLSTGRALTLDGAYEAIDDTLAKFAPVVS